MIPTPRTSFAANILKQKALIYAFTAPQRGTLMYYVLEVNASKHNAFKQALKDSVQIKLEEFGSTIYQGATPPSPELAQQWQEKYELDISAWY